MKENTLPGVLHEIYAIILDFDDAFSKLPAIYNQSKKDIKDIQGFLTAAQTHLRRRSTEMLDAGPLVKSLTNLLSDAQKVRAQCQDLFPPIERTEKNLYALQLYRAHNVKGVHILISLLKTRIRDTLRQAGVLSNTDEESDHGQSVETTTSHPYLRLMAFTQSRTALTKEVQEAVSFRELSSAYLRREFKHLETLVQKSSLKWFGTAPATVVLPELKTSWLLRLEPTSNTTAHKRAVMLIFQICNILEAPNQFWMDTVDAKLSYLSLCLNDLKMNEEVIAANNLRVDLWASMATAYPKSNAPVRLVSALTNLSISLSNCGEAQQSHKISDQAANIVDSLSSAAAIRAVQSYIPLHLAVASRNHPNPAIAIASAESSVRHTEALLGIDSTSSIFCSSRAIDVFVPELDKTSHDLLFTYAHVIYILSHSQHKNKMPRCSYYTAKRSLVVLNHLRAVYPTSERILLATSSVLTLLAHPDLAMLNSADESLRYAIDNEEIQAQLFEVDPKRYLLSFLSGLHTKRNVLLSLGKTRQARTVHQRMVNLGNLVMDSYSDLKIPSEVEGDYYFMLANYHCSCMNFQDAIYSAQNAISQYAALGVMVPDQSPVKHIKAIVFLCNNHAFLKQYDACIQEGLKALHVIDTATLFQKERAAIADMYMELLDRMMEVLDCIADTRVLEWARDINLRIQKLFASTYIMGHKISIRNAQAPSKYASILRKHDLLEEASAHLQDTIARWDHTYGTAENGLMISISYLQCLMEVAQGYRLDGETDKALQYSQQAMNVAEQYFRSADFPALKTALYNNLASMHIYLLCDAGRYSEALELSQHAVAYIRENEHMIHKEKNMLAQALGGLTICFLYMGRPREAVDIAMEAILLCRNALEGHQSALISRATHITLLYVSLLNLSDTHGDAGDADQALIYLSEAKDILAESETANSHEPGSEIHSHQVLAQKEARLLFMKGNYERAAQLIKAVIEKERERAKTRKHLVSSLIGALQFAGVVYCTLGLHDEGAQVASEVLELKSMLNSSPGLLRLVRVEEQRMVLRGKWKSVQSAKDRLTCDHQDLTIFPSM